MYCVYLANSGKKPPHLQPNLKTYLNYLLPRNVALNLTETLLNWQPGRSHTEKTKRSVAFRPSKMERAHLSPRCWITRVVRRTHRSRTAGATVSCLHGALKVPSGATGVETTRVERAERRPCQTREPTEILRKMA